MDLYGLGDGFYDVRVSVEFKFIRPPESTAEILGRDALNTMLAEKADRFARWLRAQFESGKDSDSTITRRLKE